ncbi:MAG: glycosyltransferase family 4 protein [Candidatus Omnitrophota bacterium]
MMRINNLPKKVIFITREGYELSGARVRCYNFARELRFHGVDASVFSFAEYFQAKYGEKEFEMSLWYKLWLNVRALFVLMKEPRHTIFVLQRFNYHALAPLMLAGLKRHRVVFDCDDWNIRENPVYYFGFYPSSKMEYLTRCVARKAVICLAASHYLQVYLKQFNPRVYYLPTGVDTQKFFPVGGKDRRELVFSWIGTAYHEDMGHNLDFLLSCFESLADQYSHVVLCLAGEGKYFEQFRLVVKGHRHAARVRVSPWIAADDMPAYLAGVDVGLLPLIQLTKFNVSKSPTKLFEYMAMGLPGIASDTGEAGHILRHGETGFLAQDRDGFLTSMRMMVENDDLRRDMGRQARRDVEARFAVSMIGSQLAGILNDI